MMMMIGPKEPRLDNFIEILITIIMYHVSCTLSCIIFMSCDSKSLVLDYITMILDPQNRFYCSSCTDLVFTCIWIVRVAFINHEEQ